MAEKIHRIVLVDRREHQFEIAEVGGISTVRILNILLEELEMRTLFHPGGCNDFSLSANTEIVSDHFKGVTCHV